MARTANKHSGRNSLVELMLMVAVAVGLALGIQAFLVKPFTIPSESMEPTLDVGQRVLVNRVSKNFDDYDRGDILVFNPPRGAEGDVCGVTHSDRSPCPRPTAERSDTHFIKRVVAVGGDRLKILGGRVFIDGKRQSEPFIRPCSGCADLPQAITVPKGHYFMMGDNRGASDDSRVWGPIPKDWVTGNAFATYWPPGRVGTL